MENMKVRQKGQPKAAAESEAWLHTTQLYGEKTIRTLKLNCNRCCCNLFFSFFFFLCFIVHLAPILGAELLACSNTLCEELHFNIRCIHALLLAVKNLTWISDHSLTLKGCISVNKFYLNIYWVGESKIMYVSINQNVPSHKIIWEKEKKEKMLAWLQIHAFFGSFSEDALEGHVTLCSLTYPWLSDTITPTFFPSFLFSKGDLKKREQQEKVRSRPKRQTRIAPSEFNHRS